MLAEVGLFKFLQTFWGLAVIVGLGGYSLYEAAQPTDASFGRASGGSGSSSAAVVVPTIDLTPRPAPPGGYPTPSPLTIFFACNGSDGDSVRYYVPAPGGYVVLRTDTDRDAIVALLNGEPTRYPANANLVQTPCVRSMIRSGTFP